MVILRKTLPGLTPLALARFAGRARRAAAVRGPVNVLLTSSAEMRRLNRDFRGKDRPTDVLSFPSEDGGGGDIAICAAIARSNARRLGHSAAQEAKVLVLHGMLHLAGYDHETDGGRMLRREARLRRELGLPDSLIARARRAGGRS